MERNPLALSASIIGAAIIITGAIVTYGFYEVKSLADTISVTGSADREVEYFYSKLNDLKQQILADAMADAKMRAEKMAESAGGKLGALRSSSMGVLQITARNSVEISDYGMYDTSAEEKKVTAVVRAEFGIK